MKRLGWTTALIIALLLLMPRPSPAEEAAHGDDDLVARCAGDLEETLYGAAAHEPAMRLGTSIRHDGSQAFVHLDLASGEGRSISGTCRFRDGKLVDVKR